MNKLFVPLSILVAACVITGALIFSRNRVNTSPIPQPSMESTWRPEDELGISATATKIQIDANRNYRMLLEQARKCIEFAPAYKGLSLSVFLESGYYWNVSSAEKTCMAEWRTSLDEYLQKQLEEESATWPIYTNETLGISFAYPPVTDGEAMQFVQAGNILYLTDVLSQIYTHRDEIMRLKNDREIIDKIKKLLCPGERFCMASWMIITKDSRSDSDLEQLIQDRVGKSYPNGCKLGKLSPSKQEGIYDVGIDAVQPDPQDGGNSGNSSCWLNWWMPFKYSATYKRAAVWDIGQDARFFPHQKETCQPHSYCNTSFADKIMENSFRFIPRKTQ